MLFALIAVSFRERAEYACSRMSAITGCRIFSVLFRVMTQRMARAPGAGERLNIKALMQ